MLSEAYGARPIQSRWSTLGFVGEKNQNKCDLFVLLVSLWLLLIASWFLAGVTHLDGRNYLREFAKCNSLGTVYEDKKRIRCRPCMCNG